MNPPSAIQGAMGRERKPFTYTPGGLDLSEIKSERMAKRLMRNAMNQGVPDLPPQPVQSPTTPTTPIAVPNFNALPVQVFPTFNLPANPKSLLKNRNNIREPPKSMIPPPSAQNIYNNKPSGMDQLRETLSINSPAYNPVNNSNANNERQLPVYEYNNNRPSSMYEFSSTPNIMQNLSNTTYGSDAHTSPVLPEICYDAKFFQVASQASNGLMDTKKDSALSNVYDLSLRAKDNLEAIKTDLTLRPLTEIAPIPAPDTENIYIEDHNETDNDDQTVKVVKKVKKAEKKVESEVKNQNGDQNGETEAEMTVVKVPSKKSAAKTETHVEVVKKTLPDGSIEEIKTTTTKTTVDGKTSIATKTETKVIPKPEDDVEEIEEEEEEEEGEVVVEKVGENGLKEEEPTTVVIKKTVTQAAPVVKESLIKKEESAETTTTKKVVVVQKEEEVEEEEEQEEEEEEEVKDEPETTTVIIKKKEEKNEKQEAKETQKVVVKQESEEEVEEEEEEEEVAKVVTSEEKSEPPKKVEPEPEEEEEVEEEEEYEEAEELEDKPEPKPQPEEKPEQQPAPQKNVEEEEDESEYTEEEIESEKEESPQKTVTPASVPAEAPAPTPVAESVTSKPESEKVEVKVEGKEEEPLSKPVSEPADESKTQAVPQTETKVPLREPSIPLEKVEDVEIKPIGALSETISKSHTEKTEIISGLPEKSSGAFSTQTEYNKIENIVTVNRTTKTLDHTYEQLTQQGVPTVRTYFAPGRERVSPTPQPARPYQSFYTPPPPQPQVERRHSLLLDRLSTERQMPSDIYQKQTSLQQQYSNQNYEQQKQWSQEPQSEVVNDSNVKPSTITKNQQWYQQSKKENILYNNITPSTPAVPSQQWNQPPPQPQPQPQVQHQHQVQAQPHYDYQQPYEIYTDNSLQDSSKFLSNSYQQNSYPSYTPAPNNWSNTNVSSTLPNVNTQPANQYSYLNKTSSENYQNTNQQYSSSYVPPPWEQDPNYVAPQLPTQSFYQPEPPSTNTFSPAAKPGWKPSPPAGKFSKPAPKSFIPPAPNQSFVKAAVPETAKRPGCKTYYSEYERRYITVPESTYIPADAKYQAQPDPSPQYYYDNNEPSEAVEHQWRKELREFTEKSQTTQTQQTNHTQQFSQQSSQHISEQKSVIPPWEEDPKYAKVPSVSYTPTPSWSQTIRPQTNRERSFESEYVQSNEWSKTNTLGRSRPLSTYQNSNIEISTPERPRGVSVDRYNPTKYQPPMTIPYDSEHGPVQAHTLDPTTAPHRGYHNPNVPAYHANRASVEPREHQQTTGQARNWCVDSRATPVQSRSFKYLQWITGTED